MLNEGGSIREVNGFFVTLVPKIKKNLSMKDYIPIALCNIIYKVVAKVLAMRLCVALHSVIGDQYQSASLKGYQILDNIIIAHK